MMISFGFVLVACSFVLVVLAILNLIHTYRLCKRSDELVEETEKLIERARNLGRSHDET